MSMLGEQQDLQCPEENAPEFGSIPLLEVELGLEAKLVVEPEPEPEPEPESEPDPEILTLPPRNG
jgi:hypothetical protein